jgi:predicted XRE-type DNA-binding protein
MAPKQRRTPEDCVTESSGNVIADLGLKDPDNLMAKAVLATHIKSVIKARSLTQARAAEILGIDQPKVSAVTSGRLEGFSSDRLMRFLNALGCDVKISVSRPHRDTPGHVVFAEANFHDYRM